MATVEYELLVGSYREQKRDENGEPIRRPGGGYRSDKRVKGDVLTGLHPDDVDRLLAVGAIKRKGAPNPPRRHAFRAGARPLAPTGDVITDQKAYRSGDTSKTEPVTASDTRGATKDAPEVAKAP
jgi:hypothetical protein